MSQHVVSVESSSLLHYRLIMDKLKTSTRTEQIYVFITMEAEGEGWDPKKLA